MQSYLAVCLRCTCMFISYTVYPLYYDLVLLQCFFITDVDAALNSFTELKKLDPYRLEDMDILSNLLYVKEMRHDLAHLAHKCCDIDKYRVETCCVIGKAWDFF